MERVQGSMDKIKVKVIIAAAVITVILAGCGKESEKKAALRKWWLPLSGFCRFLRQTGQGYFRLRRQYFLFGHGGEYPKMAQKNRKPFLDFLFRCKPIMGYSYSVFM